ncbi:hypothetical protein BJY04DRAFT_216954 [Aspergillus karnatakaensis]|uniref:J domain-containing protein n=1 Tax=Aspergillus karnatakaensis TaxID=1810916 RepID=UPI003CCE3CA9
MLKPYKFAPYNGLLFFSQIQIPLLPRSRLYTTTSTPTDGDFPGKDHTWPSTPSFTPYDVIGLPRSAPYSKHRFYELVKIYHPDRPSNNHPLCKDITPEVRLQRYRIVVTAHEILSNPIRRAAYDQRGTGWNHDTSTIHYPRTPSEYNPIYANATWEDWERWYNRHGQKQETVVDHKTFVTFVVLLFFMGAAVQASWFTQVSTGYEDRLRDLNAQSSRFLMERRNNTVRQMEGSEAKVQHFLIRRDPSGSGLRGEGGVYRAALDPRGGDSSGRGVSQGSEGGSEELE